MERKSSGKAWMAGTGTFVAVLAAIAGFGDMPAQPEIMDAVLAVCAAAGAAAVNWFMTWWKTNHPIEK
jgi:hypothetical protein